MRVFVFLFFIGVQVLGQDTSKPFELERFGPDKYGQIQDPNLAIPQSANELGLVYFQIYKQARASQPAKYFPKPTLKQKKIGSMLESEYPESSATAFVTFIESEGDLEACAALAARAPNFSAALPYRWIAAHILGLDEVEKDALRAMQELGWVSPFIRAFGRNLLISAEMSDICITQGMLDFMAVRSAQLLDGYGPNVKVYNAFISGCAAWKGAGIEEILSRETERIFIAPTMSAEFLERHASHLWIQGLGYAYLKGPDIDAEDLVEAAEKTAKLFSKEKIQQSERCPATDGILKVYKSFLDRYAQMMAGEDSRKDQKLLGDLEEWLTELER